MSIPFYDDIYKFPGGYFHHHKHFDRHGLKPSYVQETSKSIDIYDKLGNLRYNVTLSSEMEYNGRGYKTIVSQSLPEGVVAFLEIPDNDEWEIDYHQALEDFKGCVERYQSLVNAEMRDFRDIEVYKDKIGYEVQIPEKCCGSCKWCMKTFVDDEKPYWDGRHHGKHHGKPIKMQCCCPQNEQVFNYTKSYPQMPGPTHHFNGWQKLPWQKPDDISLGKSLWDPRRFPSIIFPTVDALGICDFYEKGKCEYDRHKKHDEGCQQLAKTIAPVYDVSLSCIPGDLVYYCGALYECIEDHPGGIWVKEHFARTTIDEALKSKVPYDDLSDAISDAMSVALSSYVTQDDLSDALSSSLSGYVTNDEFGQLSASLSSYATFVDVSSMISVSMSACITSGDVADIVDSMTSSIAADVEAISGSISILSDGISATSRRIAEINDDIFAVSSAIGEVSAALSSYASIDDIHEVSSGLMSASDDIRAVSASLSNYMLTSDVSGYVTSAALSSYVKTDALSWLSISVNPTQREMTNVLKHQLSILGGTIEGGL